MTQSYINLLNSYPVIDYSRANIEALSKMAITGVNLCQIGYEPELSSIIGKMAGKEKDIDILFYGSLNERRLKVLEELKAKGVNVVHLFGVYGKKRDLYISRAKVV
ncbi:MAG: hypothetical protein GY702_16130 [Desulfobulbaceae bacterium]|nr:hypothetical protein [Desulfobulbaceae bacterium]